MVGNDENGNDKNGKEKNGKEKTKPAKGAPKAPLEFWFDFSSPYGYLASTQVEEIAADYGRKVIWRPFMLGAVFKVSGAKALTETPLKKDYAAHDFNRYARLLGVPFNLPSFFPVSGLAASRLFYWLDAQHPKKSIVFAERVFEALFVEGLDISSPDTVADIAASLGVERAEAVAAMADPEIKQRLRTVTEEAVSRSIFGSPFVIVDGEPFWGVDRLWMVEEWLENGGW